MKTINQLFFSGGSSAISTSSHLILSHFLDFVIDDNISDIIGLIVGFTINFYLQSHTFISKVKYGNTVLKFILAELFIIIVYHLGYRYIKKHDTIIKKWISEKYRNTFIRILVGVLEFIFISFPLRKYFVFL